MKIEQNIPQLFGDVCQIIDGTRSRIAISVNAEVCFMNWNIGKRIKEDVLFNQRADYGKEILKNLSDLLTEKYGKGWSLYKLQHCVRSAYIFLEEQILYAVRTQLTWTHLRSLMSLDDELKRLVVIDLKLGKFKPEHEGQMLLYLRYLNKNERKDGEESPIGLILCSEGNTEHIEYLMLEESDIKVAQYYTQLPDRKMLSEKLHKAIAIARENQTKN